MNFLPGMLLLQDPHRKYFLKMSFLRGSYSTHLVLFETESEFKLFPKLPANSRAFDIFERTS